MKTSYSGSQLTILTYLSDNFNYHYELTDITSLSIDVSHPELPGDNFTYNNFKLSVGQGLYDTTINIEGIHKSINDNSFNLIHARCESGADLHVMIITPTFTITGPLKVQDVSRSGAMAEAETYSISLAQADRMVII